MATNPKKSHVYIAGAGCGDPDLLTIKCFNLIKSCDVVIYDRLISDEIIEIIPKNSDKLYAGKSCKNHHMTQDEINACLVKYAKEGLSVLRLKGGDPFIFGRGGEEASFLFKNNISFEIIPGISAASGCSAEYSVPLTHRGIADGVSFLTGHKQNDNEIKFSWADLVKSQNTLVFYMGLSKLEYISEMLIKHKMDKNTPAMAIQEGTTKNQRVVVSNIENLYKDVHKAELKPPTIVIIGKVIDVAKKLGKL